jgi:hypothetical protein
MASALTMMGRIFSATPLSLIGNMIAGYRLVFGVMMFGFLMHWFPAQWMENIRGRYVLLHSAWKVIIAVVLFFVIYQMKETKIQPFIYFQF